MLRLKQWVLLQYLMLHTLPTNREQAFESLGRSCHLIYEVRSWRGERGTYSSPRSRHLRACLVKRSRCFRSRIYENEYQGRHCHVFFDNFGKLPTEIWDLILRMLRKARMILRGCVEDMLSSPIDERYWYYPWFWWSWTEFLLGLRELTRKRT